MSVSRRVGRLNWRRNPLVLAAVVTTIGIASLFPGALFGGKVLSANDLIYTDPVFAPYAPAGFTGPSNFYLQDSAYVFHPQMLKAREVIRQGRVPLWDPSIGAGRPLLASQLAAPAFPLTWISFLFPFWQSLVWAAALRILIPALGTFLFCRALGAGVGAAILGSVSFSFSVIVLTHLDGPYGNVFALMPWTFLLVERVCTRAGEGYAAIALGCVAGLALLGGHVESVFVIAVTSAAFAGFRTAGVRRAIDGTELRRRVLLLAGAGALGLALGAVAILPFLELLSQSQELSRSATPLSPRLLVNAFLFPEFLGRPDKTPTLETAAGFANRGVYFGALPLLLAAVAVTFRRTPLTWLLFGTAVVAFAVATNVPLLVEVLDHLPLIGIIRRDYFLWITVFFGSVLAALGLDALLSADRRTQTRMLWLAAALAALPVLIFLRHTGLLSEWRDALTELPVLDDGPVSLEVTHLAAVMRWSVLTLAVLGVITLLARARVSRTLLASFAVAIALADLVTIGRGYYPELDETVAEMPTPESVAFVQRAGTATRIAGNYSAFQPNLADRYGVYDSGNFLPPQLRRYTSLHEGYGDFASPLLGRNLFDASRPRAKELASAFGVGYILAGATPMPGEEKFAVVFQGRGDRVLRNPDALPRAFVAYDWRRASSRDEALKATLASDTSALREAPTIEGAGPRPPGGAAPRSTGARITLDGDTKVSVTLAARRAGYLVLLDTWYPGWSAEVDGQDARVLPANGAMRAVRVPAGKHEVTFQYRPVSFLAGAALSGLGILVALVCLMRVGRTRRSR